MKADLDFINDKHDKAAVPGCVWYILLLCVVFPLLAVFVGMIAAFVAVISLMAVLTAVYAKILKCIKYHITADEDMVVVIKGKSSRSIPIDELSGASYNAELVQNRFGTKCIIRMELRLASGEMIRLEKWIDLPYGLRCSVHSDIISYAEQQPLPQLCRYINQQVLGEFDGEYERS